MHTSLVLACKLLRCQAIMCFTNACKLHEGACMHGKTKGSHMQVECDLKDSLHGLTTKAPNAFQASIGEHASWPTCTLTDSTQHT